MDLTWLDSEHLEPRDVAGMCALIEASRLVDTPHRQVATTVHSLTVKMTRGWDGDPPVVAVTRDDRGRVIGLLELHLSKWDNTHLGYVELIVDPVQRRRGIGRALFEAAVDRICADGRRLILTGAFEGTVGTDFAKAMGLDRASEAIQRRQHLPELDWKGLDRAYEEAEPYATGYDLVRMAGRVPDDIIDDVVRMASAINDAPIDDLDVEDEVFTPERAREFEKTQDLLRRRLYRVVARERATGELAGNTVIAVESDRPAYGWQLDTSVVRAHRGHRLGVLLKADMLRWLAEEEPQLRVVDTWNAASNSHMIGVNELLGYEVVAREGQWQKRL